jgi:hypothetical protein
MADDFDYRDTRAALMLAEGLREASAKRGISVRQMGKRLNYKQAVVLSHWATGRVPIPIDRAVEVAREVGIPEREFLLAVLQQRHAEVDWKLISGAGDDLVEDLEDIAGRSLSSLPAEHQQVMKEVVAEARPARRWLTVSEVPVMEAIREQVPFVRSDGMPRSMIELLSTALKGR